MSGFRRRAKCNVPNPSLDGTQGFTSSEASGAIPNPSPSAIVGGTPRLPPGTRPSRRGGAQLITSTGLPALDALLGGGIAIGSTLLLREDTHMRYARVLVKLFLSQGFATEQGLALASAERSPKDVFKMLFASPSVTGAPTPTQTQKGVNVGCAKISVADPTSTSATGSSSNSGGDSSAEDPMHIAWRYQNVKRVQSEIGGGGGGRARDSASAPGSVGINFDISVNVDATINAAVSPICYIDLRDMSAECDYTETHGRTRHPDECRAAPLLAVHQSLFDRVYAFLEDFQDNTHDRGIARVVVETLDSPLLLPAASGTGSYWTYSAVQLVHRIRALVRTRLAVCLITVQGTLMPSAVLGRMLVLSDAAVELEGFAGTPNENSAALKEYHGFFRILKLPRINTLTCYLPDTLDLAFKLKRRKFVIEKLHLPPDLSETVSRSSGGVSKSSSHSGGKNACSSNLDF